MLRPSEGLLGSSKAARRRSLRAELFKTVGQVFRAIRALVFGVLGWALDVLLLLALPLLYLGAAYLTLDLPARWLSHRPAWGSTGALVFAGAAAMCLVGISRYAQDAEPVAPVRPRFAKAMLALSWVTGLLLTLGDLAS